MSDLKETQFGKALELMMGARMRVYGDIRPPAKAGDAGFDLTASGRTTIFAGGSAVIDTGIHVEIHPMLCGIIIGRSSLNTLGIQCVVGLIDSGYRGSIRVVLQNKTGVPYEVNRGDRIAQLVLTNFYAPTLEFVGSLEELQPSERGADGFGSTGV